MQLRARLGISHISEVLDMRFYFLALVLICLCPISLSGQGEWWFNKNHDFGYPSNSFRDFDVRNDTIAGYGLIHKFVDSTWLQGVLIAQMDSSGNVINFNTFTDPLGDDYSLHRYWGKMVPTSDGGYAMTTAPFGRNSAVLIKVDSHLELEFIKEYPDSINISNFIYIPFEVANGYILYGAIQRPDFDTEGFIKLVDKQGEELWTIFLDQDYEFTVAIDVKQLDDSTFICASYTQLAPNSTSFFSSLHYFDLDGNILKEWSSTTDSEIGIVLEIAVPQIDSIILSSIYQSDFQFNTPLYKATLSKLDSNHNLVWVNHFGPAKLSSAYNLLYKFINLPSGEYVGVGGFGIKEGSEPTKSVGWLYKFNTEGDSIWDRKLFPPFDTYDLTTYGYFTGIGQLSSGSIIAGGESGQMNEEYGWIVKVTQDGCIDTLICGTVSAPFNLEPNFKGISIYPNPSYGNFRVSVSGPDDQGQLVISDLVGTVYFDEKIEGSRNVAAQNWPKGVYFVTYFPESGTPISKRIIIFDPK